jgi:hypothetical protein
MSTKMKNLVLSFICAIAFVGCGTNNDTPEPPTNAKVDYFIEYEIDGKKEKYIIDTGHLNTVPALFSVLYTANALSYDKTYDGTNYQAGIGLVKFPVLPFGKSVYTQTMYPNFALDLVLRNFSAIKNGDVLKIDSFGINKPLGNAVGLSYVPSAPPINDSMICFYDLGINPQMPFYGRQYTSLFSNAAIKGKNGKITISSKTLHTVLKYPNLPPVSFYIVKGEITGDFMKYKLVYNKKGENVKVNLGYKTGKVSFQLPFQTL